MQRFRNGLGRESKTEKVVQKSTKESIPIDVSTILAMEFQAKSSHKDGFFLTF